MQYTNSSILVISLTDKLGGAEQLLLNIALFYGRHCDVIIFGNRTNQHWIASGRTVHYCDNNVLQFIQIFHRRKYEKIISSHIYINALLGFLRTCGIVKTKHLIARESTSVFGRYKGIKLVFYWFAYFIGYRNIDLLITQTEDMKNTLIFKLPWLQNRIKICTFPNFFVFPADMQVNEEVQFDFPFIVAAGRLIHEKGFDLLIHAFSDLLKVFKNHKLVILGEGPQRSFLERIIEEKNLNSSVLLMGRVDNVYKYFKSAAVCVVSSRREGFPNVLLQMMAVNGKVVSTTCAGDIDKIKGLFLAKPNDRQSLAKAILACDKEADPVYNQVLFNKELLTRSIENYVYKMEVNS